MAWARRQGGFPPDPTSVSGSHGSDLICLGKEAVRSMNAPNANSSAEMKLGRKHGPQV